MQFLPQHNNAHVQSIPTPAKLKQISLSEFEALELEDVKDQLAVTHDLHDHMIGRLIMIATATAEHHLNRPIMTQKRAIYYNRFPHAYSIPLQCGPVQQIESIIYHKADNSTVTIDPALYDLTNEDHNAAATLKNGQRWPTDKLKSSEGIEILFTCGYSDYTDDIPMQIQAGMIDFIRWHYQNDAEGDMPASIHQHWAPYVLHTDIK